MNALAEIPWQEAVLTVEQFNREDIDCIFELADRIIKMPTANHILSEKILANLFYEPSTRTSSSFHSAMLKMGGNVIPINEVTYSSVTKGETLEDTVRTLECYADIVVLRHNDTDAAYRAHQVCDIPIINAGNGTGEHPTQALLDLYTIFEERGTIDGLTVTLMGDLKHGRTVHSLVKLLRMYDVKINFVSPIPLQMPAEYCRDDDTHECLLDSVIEDTDVLYVTRVQKERIVGQDSAFIYGVTGDDMNNAPSNMVLMHPLPRVGEIPIEFDNDPRAAYFRQMKYGLYIRMALLACMLGE